MERNRVHYVITCDGGSRGNHDKSQSSIGYGSFMIQKVGSDGALTIEQNYGEGVTNNEAEYKALIAALKHIADAYVSVAHDISTVEISVNTDSKLMIGHLASGHKVNAPNLKPLVEQANGLISQFYRVHFNHISGVRMKEILGH